MQYYYFYLFYGLSNDFFCLVLFFGLKKFLRGIKEQRLERTSVGKFAFEYRTESSSFGTHKLRFNLDFIHFLWISAYSSYQQTVHNTLYITS